MRTLLLLGLALFLAACAVGGPTCTEPYMRHGDTCCLDRDDDRVCDVDENRSIIEPTGELDCDLCPPKFVTETQEVIVYKYVCANGTIVDSENGCEKKIVSNAHQFTPNKNQDEAEIKEFDVRPACRGKYRAAELHIVPVTPPLNLTIQVMDEPNTVYRDLFSFDGTEEILDEKYAYIGFCDLLDCTDVADGALAPDKAYLVRAVLKTGAKKATTREYVLDPTPEGKYAQQKC